jgi:hypothetical protein
VKSGASRGRRAVRSCLVCSRPSTRSYCDRCSRLLGIRHDSTKRRLALREAYDRDLDAFRCHWSRVPLDERDPRDPFHISFDHFYPVRSSRLVASSELLNSMKFELGPEEFPAAVRELAAHHGGRPFDRDAVKFEWWGRRAPAWPRPRGGLSLTGGCAVCGDARLARSRHCPRCYGIIGARHHDYVARARALGEAWSPGERRFLCHFTGVGLEEEDNGSPWLITFGRRVPGDDGTMVAAAWWVNRMKEGLSEEEFWSVVGELDECWREGREFERGVCEFKYWRRRARRE